MFPDPFSVISFYSMIFETRRHSLEIVRFVFDTWLVLLAPPFSLSFSSIEPTSNESGEPTSKTLRLISTGERFMWVGN
jgi:hypothetical protein